ncbi:MAG: hypothetical protein HFACDABA_01695 [Anaerolineales bacterium]|nr:hypothetical protein [Anaerolineales bacterium]
MSDPSLSNTLPEDRSPEARNALRIALFGFIASIIAASFYLYLGLRSNAWQMYAWSADIFALAAAILVGRFLVRRGWVKTGAWVIIWAAIITFAATVTLIEDTGLVIGVGLGVLVAVIAGQTLPPASARRAIYLGIAGAILSILLDLYLPPYRLPQPEATRIFMPGIIAAVIIIFGFVILRQFRDYSLRTKFLISVFVITGLTIGIYSYFTFQRANQTQAVLSDQLQATMQEQSRQTLTDTVQREVRAANQLLTDVTNSLRNLAEYRAALYSQAETLGEGAYWNADTLIKLDGGQYGNDPSAPGSVFIPSFLSLDESLARDLNATAYLDFIAPSMLEANPNIIALYYIGKAGNSTYYPNIGLATLVPPDFDARTGIFYSIAAPENNPQRLPDWTPPYQDPAGMGLLVTNSIPVYDQRGTFRGVMGADVQLTRIAERVAGVQIGQSGFAFLIDSEGRIIAMTDAGYAFFGLQREEILVNETPQQVVTGRGSAELQAITRQMTLENSGLSKATVGGTEYYLSYAPLGSIGYSIALVVPVAELDAAYLAAVASAATEARNTQRLATLILIAALLITFLLSQWVGQILSRSLLQLRDAAQQVSQGNLNARTVVESKDEIGVLGETFNSMTAQLRGLIGGLEQRVADRTKALTASAEVSRHLSTIVSRSELVKEVVEEVQRAFDYYHTHIYLVDETSGNLAMVGGTGEAGQTMLERGHTVTRGRGLVGRAAETNEIVLVPDTSKDPDWLPNPLLPETKSEIAVPITAGENVLGVLDVQHNVADALGQEDAKLLDSIANQVAIALQNSRQYDATQSALAQSERLFESGRRLTQSADLQELVKTTVEALGIPAIDRAILGSLSYNANDELGGMSIIANWSKDANLPATPIGTHYPKQALNAVSLFSSSAPLFFNDMLNDARVDEATLAVAKRVHYRSVAALPLFLAARRDAILLLEGEQPHNFTQDEIRLFSALAPQIATVMENRRQFERAQKQAKHEVMLNAISQKIQGAATIEAAMQVAARELGHALGKPALATLETSAPSDESKIG